jgi:hypothetical protein
LQSTLFARHTRIHSLILFKINKNCRPIAGTSRARRSVVTARRPARSSRVQTPTPASPSASDPGEQHGRACWRIWIPPPAIRPQRRPIPPARQYIHRTPDAAPLSYPIPRNRVSSSANGRASEMTGWLPPRPWAPAHPPAHPPARLPRRTAFHFRPGSVPELPRPPRSPSRLRPRPATQNQTLPCPSRRRVIRRFDDVDGTSRSGRLAVRLHRRSLPPIFLLSSFLPSKASSQTVVGQRRIES